jgi:ATP-binding cassette, subfamily C (CFTR/MRP), member 1
MFPNHLTRTANALGIFSPIITLAIFSLVASLRGSALDTETAFTTTALLRLVTHPANMIMTVIPQAVGSLAAFERIQDYLLLPPRHEQRSTSKRVEDNHTNTPPAVVFEDVTIQTTSSMPPLLSDINIVINRGSLVVCSGPVGSGKTMLAKSLMGELATAGGTISVSSRRIAWCEQSPWLPSGTLREAVCGFCPDDQSWYEHVIRLCCLDEDLLALPSGDHTMIGCRGLNLSGGQRQRLVCLLPRYYSLCEAFTRHSFLSEPVPSYSWLE